MTWCRVAEGVRAPLLAVAMLFPLAAGAAPSGAVITTLEDASKVSLNQFPSREEVYLDGGPGLGAPPTAPRLSDGVYVFQVTDPVGELLLSTDLATCRRFLVRNGIIVASLGGFRNLCRHVQGHLLDPRSDTVQLMPFLETPDRRGVYKLWATPQAAYLEGCAQQGVPNGLDVVDCGPPSAESGGVAHGFIPAESMTDNFMVGEGKPRELDVIFIDRHTGDPIDGLAVIWIDAAGARNTRWSVWAPWLLAFHEAHVENVETGVHGFEIFDQPGCAVREVVVDGRWMPTTGPQTVRVPVRPRFRSGTIWVHVYCD